MKEIGFGRQERLDNIEEAVELIRNDKQNDKEQIDIRVEMVPITKECIEDQSTSYKS